MASSADNSKNAKIVSLFSFQASFLSSMSVSEKLIHVPLPVVHDSALGHQSCSGLTSKFVFQAASNTFILTPTSLDMLIREPSLGNKQQMLLPSFDRTLYFLFYLLFAFCFLYASSSVFKIITSFSNFITCSSNLLMSGNKYLF